MADHGAGKCRKCLNASLTVGSFLEDQRGAGRKPNWRSSVEGRDPRAMVAKGLLTAAF